MRTKQVPLGVGGRGWTRCDEVRVDGKTWPLSVLSDSTASGRRGVVASIRTQGRRRAASARAERTVGGRLEQRRASTQPRRSLDLAHTPTPVRPRAVVAGVVVVVSQATTERQPNAHAQGHLATVPVPQAKTDPDSRRPPGTVRAGGRRRSKGAASERHGRLGGHYARSGQVTAQRAACQRGVVPRTRTII